MVFKRRDRRPIWRIVLEFFYPRGGWARAAHYVKHRLRRLPDPPHRIARGIWAGIFTTFSPFYGMHFVVAAAISWVLRGNLIAALLATFFGNPLTYLPIGLISLKTGHYLLGTEFEESEKSLTEKFTGAGSDLWHNFTSIFSDRVADWHGLSIFYDEVFYPYLIGGLIPGIIAATIFYYLSLPLLIAYQKRRKKKLLEKIAKRREKAAQQADEPPKGH